jgi:hypothetical protein
MYEKFHDNNSKFTTHENGSKVIDFIRCSPNTLQYVSKIGYIPFNECFESDHCAIYCDLDEIFFKEESKERKIIRKRLIGSNSTNIEGESYISHLYKHPKCSNIFTKADQLTNNSYNLNINRETTMKQLNEMDTLITKAT